MAGLQELEERRAFECRLSPDRALASLDEAEEFLRDRGLLTRTPDCALPSLYEACHEEPYATGGRGFGGWPATKWPWFGELADRGHTVLGIHRGKNLLVTEQITAIIDPICRAELSRLEGADPNWARLLRHLGDAGPSLRDELRVELALNAKELKLLLHPLERCGAIVSRAVALPSTDGGGHVHTSEVSRWDQVFPAPAEGGGIEELIVSSVRAAVVTPERDVGKWFSWSWLVSTQLVERLVAERRLERPETGWLALPQGE